MESGKRSTWGEKDERRKVEERRAKRKVHEKGERKQTQRESETKIRGKWRKKGVGRVEGERGVEERSAGIVEGKGTWRKEGCRKKVEERR